MAKSKTEKHPVPHDPAAERGLLGGLLIHGGELLDEVAALVEAGDFRDRRHGEIFKAIQTLHAAGVPVDELTVSSQLGDKVESLGGAAYLAELTDTILSPAHAAHYARLVSEVATCRRFVEAARKAMGQVCLAGPTERLEAIDQAEQAIFAAASRRTTGDLVRVGEGITPFLTSLQDRKPAGTVASPWPELNRLLQGGWRHADLVIVAGRPGMGKSALALNAAVWAAMAGAKTAVFSLEMSREQINARLMAATANVSMGSILEHKLSTPDWDRLTLAAEKLHQLPLWVDDSPGITPMELRAKTRRLAAREGLGLVLVDYLQLMKCPGHDSREQEVSEISRSLKALAKELNVPVLALSQLNRKVEDRTGASKRPMLSDLRESGAIEQDADVILFVYRPLTYGVDMKGKPLAEAEIARQKRDGGPALVDLAKQRQGPTGAVDLFFQGRTQTFSPLERQRSDWYC